MPTTVSHPTADWQEIGVGPKLIEAMGKAYVTFGDAMPEDDTWAYHIVGDEDGNAINYTGTEKIYARKSAHNKSRIVMTDIGEGGSGGSGGADDMPAPKPIVTVVNDEPRITVNAQDPVVIMTAEIEIEEPGKLAISGVINGTFYYVCGVAIYVDGNPISLGRGTNRCHADCFQIMYGNGHNGYMCPIPYETVAPFLPAGKHKIEVAVIGKWYNTNRPIYINSRSSNDMASSSSLIVRAI